MTAINGRILRSDSEWLLRVVAGTVAVIALVSFVLSFGSLTELAILALIPASVAWGWPLIVDGTIIVATFGTLILHPREQRSVKFYPWAVLIVFGALSIWANGIHAIGGQLTETEAFIVGAVAPVALLTSTHLLVVMLTSPVRETPEAVLARRGAHADAIARASRAPAAVVPVVSAAPVPAPRPPIPRSPSTVSSVGRLLTTEDAVTRILSWPVTHDGTWPSGPEVGGWIGKSPKTGLRLIQKARADAGQ